MEEAFLLSAIQTLQSLVVEEKHSSEPYREELDGLIKELRMIVDFLRDKKLREGSRLYYLIGDLVEIVRDALKLKDHDDVEIVRDALKLKDHDDDEIIRDALKLKDHDDVEIFRDILKRIHHVDWVDFYMKIESVRRWVGELYFDKHLVSLFFHGGGYFDTSPSYWKSFEELRILDLEDFGLKILPDSIGTLTELRYLGLRNNHIQELPQSLGCLYNLEVLDIALNFMVEVPDIIWAMDSLLHLYMSDVISRNPLKIDALENLRTLTYVSVDNWTYEFSGVQMMACLRKLGIREVDENSDVSKLFASLAKLEHLNHLILRGFRLRSMPCLDELGILHRLHTLKLDGCLAMLPSADNFPRFLSKLTLVNSCLDEDPMPVLEKLPWLYSLILRNAYTGHQMVISRQVFPNLNVLCIEELWSLRNLQVEEGAMPRLLNIEIKNCPNLETLPEEIGSMTYLKELKMVITKNVAAKIRKSSLISNIRDVDINP